MQIASHIGDKLRITETKLKMKLVWEWSSQTANLKKKNRLEQQDVSKATRAAREAYAQILASLS